MSFRIFSYLILKHERFLEQIKIQTPNVILIGDSLVQHLQNAPVSINSWFFSII
jgi:hypothetical protein